MKQKDKYLVVVNKKEKIFPKLIINKLKAF